MYKEKNKSKFLIPLDGDEFIALEDNNKNIITDPIQIRNYILSLPYDGNKYIFKQFLNAVPEKSFYDNPTTEINKFNSYLKNQKMMKKFYPSTTFISTDHGNHYGVVQLQANVVL